MRKNKGLFYLLILLNSYYIVNIEVILVIVISIGVWKWNDILELWNGSCNIIFLFINKGFVKLICYIYRVLLKIFNGL